MPPQGWRPPFDWPPAPPGWQFWIPDPPAFTPRLTKTVNFLVEDAHLDPNPTAEAVLSGVGGVSSSTEAVLDAFRARYGGLWVGGTLSADDWTVQLRANALNQALQSGTLDIVIPLVEITDIVVLPGLVTKVLAIDVGYRRVKARCYGARETADELAALVVRARGGA